MYAKRVLLDGEERTRKMRQQRKKLGGSSETGHLGIEHPALGKKNTGAREN